LWSRACGAGLVDTGLVDTGLVDTGHPGLQRPLRENIATPLCYNAKVPFIFQFHEGFLRVTSILTAYLQ